MKSNKYGNVDVFFKAAAPISESEYPGFEPASSILKKGSIYREGGQPIPCDMICERDVSVELRDGTIIYTDIFRPVDGTNIPALVVWSPYGKRASWLKNDLFENRMDVPSEWEDGLNKFEGPNPGYWVSQGYAIIHPDPRGIFNSEDKIYAWGEQEAQDEYDLIEWVAERDWSNGRIGLTGNSWLAMSQWNVAAQRPPHLSAIAPWEGAIDIYREASFKGGIPDFGFAKGIFNHLYGNSSIEDLPKMMECYPLMNEYWESKIVRLEDIIVPAYVVASYTNVLHTNGTFEAWKRISSENKWLRVHNTHEWYDYYVPEHVEDLRRFFDCFLKGMNNGWKETPIVRLAIHDPGHEDIINREEEDFPLKRQEFKKLYLNASSMTLNEKIPDKGTCISYTPNEKGTSFTLTFNQDTEITGYMKLKLWVAAEAADDMDVFAYVRKLNSDGNVLPVKVVTNRYQEGASGRLRVSLRQLDEDKSTPECPRYSFNKEEKLSPGEIVPIEIGFWPFGMKWHAGEQLEILITGVELWKRPEFPGMPAEPTINNGKHIIYTGERYDSYLLVPLIPVI